MREQININVNVNVRQDAEPNDETKEQDEEQVGSYEEPIEYSVARFEMFCQNRLELDKGLLTLSTAGIGFSATYLMGNKISSYAELTLFSLGALCFGICIALVLYIFRENSNYISADDSELDAIEGRLNKLDVGAATSFGLAICFVAIASFLISKDLLHKRLNSSSEEIKVTTTTTVSQSIDELPILIKISSQKSETETETKTETETETETKRNETKRNR